MKRCVSYQVVELRRPEIEQRLRDEVTRLKEELRKQNQAFRRLEDRLGDEVYLNCELVDLLRANNIRFRPYLDSRERAKLRRE